MLDGDTLEAVVDLGFGITTTQTLRFRGIDSPEILTHDGMEAKKFVEQKLRIPEDGGRKADGKGSAPIVLKTSRSDKYDRYLADIFITDKNGEEQYLNNRLLAEGHAVRVEA